MTTTTTARKASARQWEVLDRYVTGTIHRLGTGSIVACLDRGWLEEDPDHAGEYPRTYRASDAGRAVHALGPQEPDPWTQAARAGREHQRHLRKMAAKWGLGTTAVIAGKTVADLQHDLDTDWGAWSRQQRTAHRRRAAQAAA